MANGNGTCKIVSARRRENRRGSSSTDLNSLFERSSREDENSRDPRPTSNDAFLVQPAEVKERIAFHNESTLGDCDLPYDLLGYEIAIPDVKSFEE